MEFEYDGNTFSFNREESTLEKETSRMVGLLEAAGIKYVIISGYVAVLFGRTRATEDIDLFVGPGNREGLIRFLKTVGDSGYWILNAEDNGEALKMLDDGLSIRIAKSGSAVPNFEVKFARKELDFESLDNPLAVMLNGRRFMVSRPELEIPYKLWLGTDKDIEDARHIFLIFGSRLDRGRMTAFAEKLKVTNLVERYAT